MQQKATWYNTIMPEIVNQEVFLNDHLGILQRDEVAFHGMLYPGVYPSDRDMHAKARQGIEFDRNNSFYRLADGMLDRGVAMQWLRVLPDAGQCGYDDEDIAAMHLTAKAIARSGMDVRTVRFSQQVGRLLRHCGDHSPIVGTYLGAVNDPEQGPHRSFWATYRQHMGVLAVAYVGMMDYQGEEFLGHEVHLPPLEPDVKNWVRFWRNTYIDYGEPVVEG
jgi:hypothetical protein